MRVCLLSRCIRLLQTPFILKQRRNSRFRLCSTTPFASDAPATYTTESCARNFLDRASLSPMVHGPVPASRADNGNPGKEHLLSVLVRWLVSAFPTPAQERNARRPVRLM